jgi:hypothetical protein
LGKLRVRSIELHPESATIPQKVAISSTRWTGSSISVSYFNLMTFCCGTWLSPVERSFSSSTQFRAQISQGSRPSASHSRGVPPYQETGLSIHQSTRESEYATARPSLTISTNLASGKASASNGIRRLFAIRLLTKVEPPAAR